MSFLEQWQSNEDADPQFDPEAFAADQRQRLTHMAAVAQAAHGIPRRLGGEASAEDLARDKRFNKKLRNRLMSIFKLWNEDGDTPDLDGYLMVHGEDIPPEAAQFDHEVTMPLYFSELRQYLRYLAANAQTPKNKKICNRLANRIFNEITQTYQLYEEIYPENAKKILENA